MHVALAVKADRLNAALASMPILHLIRKATAQELVPGNNLRVLAVGVNFVPFPSMSVKEPGVGREQ